MKQFTVIFQPDNITLQVDENTTILQAQIAVGLHPDAVAKASAVNVK